MAGLESEIARWRSHVTEVPAADGRDIDELEAHLRDQISDLIELGLDEEEAFLVAVRRIGRVDELSREFAQEHGERLWHQLMGTKETGETLTAGGWLDAILFGVAAGIAAQIARLAAGFPDQQPAWLGRNLAFLALPFLAGFFLRRRQAPIASYLVTAAVFAVAAVLVNLYPFQSGADTDLLVALHLPVALWFVVAYPYSGGAIGSHQRRMDFVRFTGEWIIYFALIALGGGVLFALTGLLLGPTGIDEELIAEWVIPTGAAGAVVIAGWLVEHKQRVVENMAPVLTMVFTPLFAILLVVAVVAYVASGFGVAFERELIGIFNALLVIVFGLVLYGVSARDPMAPPAWADRLQLATVTGALALDAVVLGVMITRIGDLGFTPNRTAVVGLNVVLLVGLAGTAWHLMRFVSRRDGFHRLERWQTTYLPVFALWAALVVVVIPPLFSFA